MSMNSPFTPGVGLEPKFLAGRDAYLKSYQQRLSFTQNQQKNTLIMGLRGVGKSVLMRQLEKVALNNKYVPVFREVSKRNNTEDEFIQALLAEMALRFKGVTISSQRKKMGISADVEINPEKIDLNHLVGYFNQSPGDKGDKLIATLTYLTNICKQLGLAGLVLLFDEFQLLEDHKEKDQYSLSLILDAVSKIQSSTDAPFHVVFAGLPTMLTKMAEIKPHVERLFSNVIDLGPLEEEETRKAIVEPLKLAGQPERFSKDLVEALLDKTQGYPFFVQYFANEVYFYFQHSPITAKDFLSILPEVFAKLDEHFYLPRYSNLSEKERAVVLVSSSLGPMFSPTDLLQIVKDNGGNITVNAISQYILTLQEKNFLYKVRRGLYTYAMPLFGEFLKRRLEDGESPKKVLETLGNG